MDHWALKVFLAAVKCGSFNKAADIVGCTQPGVTQTVKSLEQELGCRLLERSSSGVSLTVEGEKLYPSIVAAEAALRQLQVHAQTVAKGQGLPIRIGVFASIANTFFPQILKYYEEEYPYTRFEVRVGTNELADWLEQGQIDMAVGDNTRLKNFDIMPLAADEYFAVISKNFANDFNAYVTHKQLAKYPFIMAPKNDLTNILQAKPEKQIVIDCDDDRTLLHMLIVHGGVTIMPQLSLVSMQYFVDAGGVAVRKLWPPISRSLGIALPATPNMLAMKMAKDFITIFNKLQDKADS